MTNRKIENLDSSEVKADDQSVEPTIKPSAKSVDDKVSLNYPKPVSLSDVIEQVAKWSGFNFVMEPGLNKSIQIFAPHPLDKTAAFNLFIASLETVGLRAVMLEGNVAKIVSHGLGKVAV